MLPLSLSVYSSVPNNTGVSQWILRPAYTQRKRLRFSVYFNVESVCIHDWGQWVKQTQTLCVNEP